MHNKKTSHALEKEIKHLEKMGESVSGKFTHVRDSAFARFPIVFVMLSSFGLVATFYGFEKMIDSIALFNEHPSMILLVGVITLILTGALYKKLN